MPAFATPDDVRRILGGFFEQLGASPEAAAMFASGVTLGYASSDPPCTIVLGNDRRVYVDDAAAPQPDVTLRATAETFDKLLSGELAPVFAMMHGKVKVEGDTKAAMRLMPALSYITSAYKAYRAALPS
jgi:putative sterol carrier protein